MTSWLIRFVGQYSLSKLKWVAVLAPAGLFITWEYISHFVVHSELVSEKILFMLTVVAVGLGATAFTHALFLLLERLQRQLVQQNRELASRTAALEALYEIGTGLSALLDVATIKDTAVRKARQLLGSDTAGLAFYHESSGTVSWELLAGATSEEFKSVRLNLGECVAGKVIQSGEPAIIEDAAPEIDGLPAGSLLVIENLRAVLVVPLRIAGRPIGALMVGHRTPYSFRLGDLKLLMSLANQLAVAINNARLHERLKALSVLEERDRLAREMHDGLAQLLGHLTARTAALGELLGQGKVEEAQGHLMRLREVAHEAYLDVRQSILGLRTHMLDKQGFLEALGEFLGRFSELEGIPVRLVTLEGAEALELTPTAEVQAIRIVQEALNNVRKHSGAWEAWVKVRSRNGWLTITVEDTGRGFDPQQVNRTRDQVGLQSMRERAVVAGGQLSIESAPGKGTMVTLTLPVGKGE